MGAAAAVPMAKRLRGMLSREEIMVVPCAHDALSARIIEAGGFDAAFASGFCIAASRGYPDTQLITFTEMLESIRNIVEAVKIPVFADGDNGYGNCMNVKRTVKAYARAGVACIMLEDQVQPKRCGHTTGKAVVSFEESVAKIRAAVDARQELCLEAGLDLDIVIMARTDARGAHPDGLEEAIRRCQAFIAAGADVTFLEAPLSVEEMARYGAEAPHR